MQIKPLLNATLLCLGAAGCASTQDVRAMRRPVLPPTYVALADQRTPLHENVAVYEVLNVPEVRWFDGNSVYTTRPTRRDVIDAMNQWLDDARMLAPNIGEADYLLTLDFQELSGPDVVWFTDKHAQATVFYTLTCQRPHQTRERMSYGDLRSRCTTPGQVIFEGTFEAQLQARMPGVTPEMVRSAIASGLLTAMIAPEIRDSANATANAIGIGALLGDSSARGAGSEFFQFEMDSVLNLLALSWPALGDNPSYDNLESLGVFGAGLIVLADEGADSSTYAMDRDRAAFRGALINGLIADNASPNIGDSAVRLRGAAAGALVGLQGAAPAGRAVEDWDAPDAIGSFDGTVRRHQAVQGMMRQNFNRFLFALDGEGLLDIRDAVPCSDLNPGGFGSAIIAATEETVGYDCPVGRTRPVHERPPPYLERLTRPTRSPG